MSRKAISGRILILLLIGMLTLAFNAQPVRTEPTTIIVPDDYPTIQQAINAATHGDTIFVKSGTYYERIVVDRSVSFVGENRNSTVIDGNWTGTIIHVISDSVSISGFTIQKVHSGVARGAAIHLDSASNCCISGNVLSNCILVGSGAADCGIWIDSSSNSFISGNNLSLFSYAIGGPFQPRQGNNQNIRSNLVFDSRFGIYLDRSDNSVVCNNLVLNCSSLGLFILHCGNATLTNNNMTSNFRGFRIWGFPLSHFVHNIDTSNTVDGDPIHYLMNEKDHIIDPISFVNIGFLALVNSTNIVIKDLNLTGKSQGLVLAHTTISTVMNVNASFNNDGIALFSSSNNIIRHNILLNRHHGIELLHGSHYNVICNNIIMNNTNQGIVLDGSHNNIIKSNTVSNNEQSILLFQSSNNVVFHNNFLDNSEQVIVYKSTNVWDNGYLAGGNHWSDYSGEDIYKGSFQNETGSDGIGDTPYVIDGNNQDNYPLMKPYGPLFGDLNEDGRVRIDDLYIAAEAFGTEPDHPRWNPMADLNDDGQIRVDDILSIALNFGKP